MSARLATLALEDAVSWVEPGYSRAVVNRAGKALITSSDEEVRADARIVLSNWRSAHGWPLATLAVTLKERAKKIDGRVLVVQRLKRLVSIENKLLRRQETRATQIQDIGGCRIIVPTMRDVNRIKGFYEIGNSRVFSLHRTDDYIAQPKDTGYRSLHWVYRYDSPLRPQWKNMRIELQVRTQIQHIWATAVEVVSFFLGQDFKAGEGNARWLRLFVLAAHWIALEERCPGVQGIPDDRSAFVDELGTLWRELSADEMLTGWSHSVNFLKQAQSKGVWRYLLHLNLADHRATISNFLKKNESEASAAYAKLELRHAEDPRHHIVLVAADSVKQLHRGFPSFFADTNLFRRMMERAISPSRPAPRPMRAGRARHGLP
jgi:ppGpp synthetase/RelA/SpoT-type nucleotidyltranferase